MKIKICRMGEPYGRSFIHINYFDTANNQFAAS